MSDSPAKKNPWAKLLAKPGVAVPPTETPPTPPPSESAPPLAAKPALPPEVKKNPWAKSLANQGAAHSPAESAAAATASAAKAMTPVSPPMPTPTPPLRAASNPPAAVTPAAAKAIPWGKSPGNQGASRALADALQTAAAPMPWIPPPPIPNPPTRPPAFTPAAESAARPAPKIPAAKLPDASEISAKPRKVTVPDQVTPSSGGRSEAVSDEMAAALAQLAAEYAPLPITNAPFVSATQRNLESSERQRARRAWLFKRAALLVAALGVLYGVATWALFQLPPDEDLATQAAETARQVLPLYSTTEQPLAVADAVPLLTDNFGFGHLRYHVEVTLRLRQPLYGPAVTNGTVGYRVLQESLQRARDREQNLGLELEDGVKPPDLPRLLQLVHRAGEPLVVRVPFEAKKFGWKWRLAPPRLELRTGTGNFSGAPLEKYGDAPYLVFGNPDTMMEIRTRMAAARDYIVAVNKAAQHRSSPELDTSALRSERESAPVASPAVAIPDILLSIDPDKPAVAAPKPPPR